MEGNNQAEIQRRLPIHVIGISASGICGLSLSKQKIIQSAKKLSAPRRTLSELKEWWSNQNSQDPFPDFFESDKPNDLINWLKQHDQQIVVLASGDPLWYGIGRLLLKNFPSDRLVFHPSPTSLQLAFSKLAIPWQDASWISLHARDSTPLIKLLQKQPEIIGILTDPNKGGAIEVKEILHGLKLEHLYQFWICEKLGHKKERIFQISNNEIFPSLDPLHLVILIKEQSEVDNDEEIPLFGVEDSFYLTHKDRPSLITKREIRIQVLADLELPKNGVIWDIGAGAGTIGLEAIRIRPELKLLSIEKRIGGKELIHANAKRLSVSPKKIMEAEAFSLLQGRTIPKDLSKPDRIILGGGSSNKMNLLEAALKRLSAKGIIVIPLATLESLEKTLLVLKSQGCSVKVSHHQNFRGVPLSQGTRLHPINPVFIIKGKIK